MSKQIDGKQFKALMSVGKSLAIIPIEYRPSIPTAYGNRPAWKVDVLDLESGDRYVNVLLFQKALISQIEKLAEGEELIGTLEARESGTRDENGEPFVYLVMAPATSVEFRLAAKHGV